MNLSYLRITLLSACLIALAALSSCDDDESNPAANSRKVKLEITGNYTGQLNVIYMASSGGVISENITLTWTKEIEYETSVPSMSMSVGGVDGQPGETITLKIFSGGKEKSSTMATADNNGRIVMAAPSLVF